MRAAGFIDELSGSIRFGEQHAARVSLLHVIETVNLPDDDELREFYAQLEKRARSQLAEMAKRFDGPVPAITAHDLPRFAPRGG